MKPPPHPQGQRSHAAAFTLLETLLAVFIFSTAIVSLVEAVNQMGKTTLLQRREAMLQDRMRSLLVESSRSLWLTQPAANAVTEKVLEEDGVIYTRRISPLQLSNRDGQQLPDMIEVVIFATWFEGTLPQDASASTWVYRPLFRPAQ